MFKVILTGFDSIRTHFLQMLTL